MNENIFDRIPTAQRITSRTNPLVSSLAKLEQAKHRREQQLFLAEGRKLSEEAAGREEIRYILLRSDNGSVDSSLIDLAAAAPDPRSVIVLPASTFDKISTENAPQGIITVLAPFRTLHAAWDGAACASMRGNRVLAVDGVQDPGNLGTILRTASAFGYSDILLGGCADIYHPRTVRASMGALFRSRIHICESLCGALSELKNAGHRIISAALAENVMTLGDASLAADDCIVIGNEGHGISDEVLAVSDAVMKIPMAAGTESLNAGTAAAVLMWEYYRNFR